MIYDGCWYNFNEGETNLQRSSCHNVVRGRNQSVHTAVTINFRSCLLDQIDVFNILFNVSFRRQQFASFWWGRRNDGTSRRRDNRAYIKTIRILHTVNGRFLIDQVDPPDWQYYHYTAVDRSRTVAPPMASFHFQSELERQRRLSSGERIVKLMRTIYLTQVTDLANKVLGEI